MKKFNITGICVANKHYMVDTSNKLDEIIKLIEQEEYFTINRPRQFGKSTTMNLLDEKLKNKYLMLALSFENVGDEAYIDSSSFIEMFYRRVKKQLKLLKENELLIKLEEMKELSHFDEFSDAITDFVMASDKEVILMIDEVDDGSNNSVFLKFLAVLRSKYLARAGGGDYTFKSVILAGVHDVKNLRYKVRDNAEAGPNSPWNIATTFDIVMEFNPEEIATMLKEFCDDRDVDMDVDFISKRIYHYTSGYPFLVSYICKLIDEKIDIDNKWSEIGIERAIKIMLSEDNNINFESLIGNLERHDDLYNLVDEILIKGYNITYSPYTSSMKKGHMYGVIKKDERRVRIHNRIYEMVIYEYLISDLKMKNQLKVFEHSENIYINGDKSLNMELVISKYSEFMAKLHDDKQDSFIEKNARLLFSVFLMPIINGIGFVHYEPVITDRRRLDLLITYHQFKYIIELKIWNGPEYLEIAKEQLHDYLVKENLEIGYMIVHDFRKNDHIRGTHELINYQNKQLFIIYV